MHNFDSDRLAAIGLSETLAARARTAADALGAANVALFRITVVHRAGLELSDGERILAARAVPRLLRGGADALAVGDWVLAAPDAAGDLWVHHQVARKLAHLLDGHGPEAPHRSRELVSCHAFLASSPRRTRLRGWHR